MILNLLQEDCRKTLRAIGEQVPEAYGASQVVYAHCHGQSRFHDSIEGVFRGVEYRLVSGDYLLWLPALIPTE